MATLLSPLHLKNATLPNRLVMSPIALDIATENGAVTDLLINHYAKLASGFGLVIVEHSYVHPQGRARPRQLGIYHDDLIPGLKKLVKEIHRQGALAGIQISHAGARALHVPVAPSRIQSVYLSRFGYKNDEGQPEMPRRLDSQQIRQIINDFGKAAIRAQKAGFDLIEIHGAHGYLLNQFYSPLTNLRRDEYGGTLKRRLQFSIEVINKVRNTIGLEMCLFYRLGANDRLAEGTRIEDSIKAVPILQEAGIDGLELSGGLCGYKKSGSEGFFSDMAKAIKPVANVPILLTGGIKFASKANEIISENIADLVGIGGTLLKDPDWVRNNKRYLVTTQIIKHRPKYA